MDRPEMNLEILSENLTLQFLLNLSSIFTMGRNILENTGNFYQIWSNWNKNLCIWLSGKQPILCLREGSKLHGMVTIFRKSRRKKVKVSTCRKRKARARRWRKHLLSSKNRTKWLKRSRSDYALLFIFNNGFVHNQKIVQTQPKRQCSCTSLVEQ